ncbi:MAG: lamin tail domain-containing protein, partial [Candidatus Falkowbacteria bacterium]
VEIYNNSASVIDLTGWTIEEGSGLKTKLSGGLGFGAYMVFDRASLNNSGDIILLKSPDGQVIDQVVYGDWQDGNIADNAPVAAKGQSVARKGQSFFVTTTITKTAVNIITAPIVLIVEPAPAPPLAGPVVVAVVDPAFVPPSGGASADKSASVEQPIVVKSVVADVMAGKPEPVQFSDALVVNEILPDPDGDDAEEWIEIYNTGAVPVNLYKWQIDDIDGGSKPYTVDEPLIIQALGYVVFSRKQTLIILNNDKDSSRLIDPAGKVVSSINYTNPPVGQSFARFPTGPARLADASSKRAVGGASWQWSAKTTAGLPLSGAANELPAPVVVKKSVSLVKTAYAQSAFAKATADKSAVTKVMADKSAVTKVMADKVDAALVGKLVMMSGEIVDKSGRKIYLADDSGEAAIYFPTKLSDVNLAMFGLGDKASATGIVKKYKDELRIVARSAQDLVVTEKNVAAAKLFSNNQPRKIGWVAWLIAFCMAAAAGVYWIIVRRRRLT